jgi:2-polyprenyl-3-methyl-5-hydroxy-6-metoxy-1,4-benzoquinol methylase
MNMDKFEELDYFPDVIIFGEVIEHLMNLEVAISNLKR